MLIFLMSVSVDGFIADREGAFDWTPPSHELFGFHLAQVRELGGYLPGRRLYETMLFRYPVVVGGGRPFLPPVTEDVPLDLTETRTFGSRVIYERYRRLRDDSD